MILLLRRCLLAIIKHNLAVRMAGVLPGSPAPENNFTRLVQNRTLIGFGAWI
jgi:hypothetical protein